MNYTSVETLIKRYISPHWRDNGREFLMKVICTPLYQLFSDLQLYRNSLLFYVNVNSQVRVLENYLERKFDSGTNFSIIDGDFMNHDFIVYMTGGDIPSEEEVRLEVNKFKIAGKRYIVIAY